MTVGRPRRVTSTAPAPTPSSDSIPAAPRPASVQSKPPARTSTMRVVACAEPDRLVVVVRDYGCGMSPNPISPGLGLGLAVIGRLATELNIERPEEGGGTRLRMCFANG